MPHTPSNVVDIREAKLVLRGAARFIVDVRGPVVVLDVDRPIDAWAVEGLLDLLAAIRPAFRLVLVAITMTDPYYDPSGEHIGRHHAYWVDAGTD